MWQQKAQDSVIGKDMEADGAINWRGRLVVEGAIAGTLKGDELIVEKGGRISADTTVRHVVVRGMFKGRLMASGRLEIGTTGVCEGEMICGSIRMEAGGRLNANVSCLPGKRASPSDTREARPSMEVDHTPGDARS